MSNEAKSLRADMSKFTIAALLLTMVAISGCDLLDDRIPDQATLLIEGTSGEEIQLITSKRFITRVRERLSPVGLPRPDTTIVTVLTADTLTITLPYEETYQIRDTQRFLATVIRANPDEDELTMKAWIDGRLKYDVAPAPSQAEIQFLYFFSDAQEPDPVEA